MSPIIDKVQTGINKNHRGSNCTVVLPAPLSKHSTCITPRKVQGIANKEFWFRARGVLKRCCILLPQVVGQLCCNYDDEGDEEGQQAGGRKDHDEAEEEKFCIPL